MRLPISSVIASLVVALTTPNSPAVAQQGSTIRLTSASEPARDSEGYETTAGFEQAVPVQQYDPPPMRPVQQPTMESGPSITMPVAQAPAQPEPQRQLQQQAQQQPQQQPAMNRTRMPAGLYASAEARSTLSQLPGPAPIQPTPRVQANRRSGKPFQGFQNQSTISPYMYMNAGTNTATPITNYLAFVRPEQEKEQASRQQEREIQQLRTQVQKMSAPVGANGQQSTRPSSAARYMDTAQFYRGYQR